MNIVGNWAEAPTKDQWVARDKIMLDICAQAEKYARLAVNKGDSYSYSADSHYQTMFLSREIENCFRCGNWLSTIVMAAAVIETFLSGYLEKGSQSENFLDSIKFPEKELYKKIIDSRNSIMHLRNKSYASSFYKTPPEELFELAKTGLWLSYFLTDFVLYTKHS